MLGYRSYQTITLEHNKLSDNKDNIGILSYNTIKIKILSDIWSVHIQAFLQFPVYTPFFWTLNVHHTIAWQFHTTYQVFRQFKYNK